MDLRGCIADWPVGWEEVDASSAADFREQCRNRWAAVRADLEPRQLEDGLTQCEEARVELSDLGEQGELCDSLRALYVD